MCDFVHLHCHTEYSLLKSTIRIKDLCRKASDNGMQACAITDYGNLFGVPQFFSQCKRYGLKPIIGCEIGIRVEPNDTSKYSFLSPNHLILLAQNNTGYHNLVKLVSRGLIEGSYYYPQANKAHLTQYSEGLVCLSACSAGEIPQAILAKEMDKARALANEFATIYPGRFYLELQPNGIPDHRRANAGLLELAETLKLPVVATNDCHYLEAKDADAYEVLICSRWWHDMERLQCRSIERGELYYKTAEEMDLSFGNVPEALANTARIAESCNVELNFGHHHYPLPPLPEGASVESEFRRLAEEGLKKRLEAHPVGERLDADRYRERLEYEISVIIEKGLAGYFLIVQEFVNWAKNNNISVGPGRGTAVGSLVAWALKITTIDPLPHKLLFERFLNVECVSMLKIDVDFCKRRRAEVIMHMVETYGADSVAQLTTFRSRKQRRAVEKARWILDARAKAHRVAKLLPKAPEIPLNKALKQKPELKRLYDEDQLAKRLLDIATQLEGLLERTSTDPVALVVSDRSLEDDLPLFRSWLGGFTTQFDRATIEKAGLPTFGLHGLKALTLIQNTLDNIARQGFPLPGWDTLPLDDAPTYDLLAQGDTDHIFQMESAGMRQCLRMLRPSCFEDISAIFALNRRGPVGDSMMEEFIKRKQGDAPVLLPHESLREALCDTYGVIIYQEQIMRIAQIVAGYTPDNADLLCRTMCKGKPKALARERISFIAGTKKKAITNEKANEIFDLMARCARHCFNKTQAVPFALISYFMAYLKVHHKAEFMAARLTYEMRSTYRLFQYMASCKDMGIEVTGPSVNESEYGFTAHAGCIIFALRQIRYVTDEASREIVSVRSKGGKFESLLDLVCRVNRRKVTPRVLKSLIEGGACDCFGVARAAMLAALDQVIQHARKKARARNSRQVSLLDMVPAQEHASQSGIGLDCPEARIPEIPGNLKIHAEKEALHFLLTGGHPLFPFRGRGLNLTEFGYSRSHSHGQQVLCGVYVVDVREVVTSSGDIFMAYVTVADFRGHADVTFTPDVYAEAHELIHSGQPLYLWAEVVGDDLDGYSLLGHHVQLLADFCLTKI